MIEQGRKSCARRGKYPSRKGKKEKREITEQSSNSESLEDDLQSKTNSMVRDRRTQRGDPPPGEHRQQLLTNSSKGEEEEFIRRRKEVLWGVWG